MTEPGVPSKPWMPWGYQRRTSSCDSVSVCLPTASPVAMPLRQPRMRSVACVRENPTARMGMCPRSREAPSGMRSPTVPKRPSHSTILGGARHGSCGSRPVAIRGRTPLANKGHVTPLQPTRCSTRCLPVDRSGSSSNPMADNVDRTRRAPAVPITHSCSSRMILLTVGK